MAGGQRESSRGALAFLVGGTGERVAVGLVLVGAAVALGALDGVRSAWGPKPWRYHPAPLAWIAAAGALALCLRPVRVRGLALAGRLAAWHPPAWVRGALALALFLALFLLRERQLFGDSNILLFAAVGHPFHFPDVGATWIFHLLARVGTATGIGRLDATQLGLCLAGAATMLCLWRLADVLAPSRGRALGFLALVLSGGLLRVLAGHVEVYALVLLAASVFLWSGCACLAGRGTSWGPSGGAALAFGVGLWLHPSFLFLAPSLVLLLASERRGGAARWWVGGLAAAAPLTLFVLAIAATGGGADLSRAYEASLAIATGTEDNGGRWLRAPFSEPGPGTRFAALSPPHLRYLANSAFLLAPTALPLLVGFGLFGGRSRTTSATTRFLALAALGSAAYACLLRPIWGPYDWDLFSLTALCLACLAAQLWARSRTPHAGSIGLLAAGAAFLLVALPFLAIGLHARHDAGPLVHEQLVVEQGEDFWEAVDRAIEPWL